MSTTAALGTAAAATGILVAGITFAEAVTNGPGPAAQPSPTPTATVPVPTATPSEPTAPTPAARRIAHGRTLP